MNIKKIADRREINQSAYRAIDALNQSSLKLFDSDPISFYKQCILKEQKPVKEASWSILVGDLTDFYLLECNGDETLFTQRFDERFNLFQGTKGTGQVYTLVDHLYAITQSYMNNEGVITATFIDRFTEALSKAQADGKYKNKSVEQALVDFNKSGTEYFESLMASVNKTTVDLSHMEKATTLTKQLLNDEFTKELFEERQGIENLGKVVIEWKFKDEESQEEITCKSELDFLRICHNTKTIFPKDLKTAYSNEDFSYSYLKYRYDIQAAFYWKAVEYWAKQNGLGEYKIAPMEFIVADTSKNNRRPLRYVTNELHLKHGLEGFTFRNVPYKGVNQLISEITWATNNNIWNISKSNYEANGIINLPNFE